MKSAIVFGVLWLALAAVRVPQVENWNIIPDGAPDGWWPLVGVRLVVASLFFRVAQLKFKLGD